MLVSSFLHSLHLIVIIRHTLNSTWAKRGSNPRQPPCKGDTLPLSYSPVTLHLSVCYMGVTPSILTVCNGVGQGSTLNIQRGLIPNVQDNDGPVAEWHLWWERLKFLTPPAGFEPATRRLTVVGSTAELQRIVVLFLCFEVEFIISLLHFIKSIHIILKPHIFT